MRHLQAVLLFIGLAANTILQLNVGVAVVAMTNATTSDDGDGEREIERDIPVGKRKSVPQARLTALFASISAIQLDRGGKVLHPV